jgi:hypothetical protein
LNAGYDVIAFPIYQGGAADARALGGALPYPNGKLFSIRLLCQERVAEIGSLATAISVCYTTCHMGDANVKGAGVVRCTK